VLKLEVIFGEEKVPSGLTMGEILGSTEKGEVLMVGEHNDGMRGSE